MFKLPKHLTSPPRFKQGVHKNFPAPDLPPLLDPRRHAKMAVKVLDPRNQAKVALNVGKKLLNNPIINPLSLFKKKKKR